MNVIFLVILINGDFMKNKYWIIAILVFIILGIGIFFLFNNQQNTNQNNYDISRTEAKLNTNKENLNNDKNDEEQNETMQETTPPPPVETEISSFTTTIYSKDSGRQNNVEITCSTLNDTIVENGDTFSFCGTVGQATTAKGYQKAEIFDAKRK